MHSWAYYISISLYFFPAPYDYQYEKLHFSAVFSNMLGFLNVDFSVF